MNRRFKVLGDYFDGLSKEKYYFSGELVFLGKNRPYYFTDEALFIRFTGLVNDGMCPAEILNGQLILTDQPLSNRIQFLKKYRYDDVVLENHIFEGHTFREPSRGKLLADHAPGIFYYGKIVEGGDKKVVLEGLYNSLYATDAHDAQDALIREAVFKNKSGMENLLEEIKGDKQVTSGTWKMDILCPDTVPIYFEVPT